MRFGVELQRDARAALRRLVERQRGDGVGAFAVRGPPPGRLGPRAAGVDRHLVGDHERGIKADAELADQARGLRVGLFGTVGRELVQERFGAGAGDRSERLGEILAAHADAVVGEGQRLGVGIDRDADRKRLAVGDEFRIGQRFVTQLLAGVGGVGDEFADEDVAFGVDGMYHQVQQARNVGFEALRFR
jgi:hypothetical protein